MSTTSKITFDANIRRARYFLDLFADAQGRGRPTKKQAELPRGAVVFAIGALDAYISELSAEVIIAKVKAEVADSGTRDILVGVQRDIPTLSLEVAILETQAARIERIQEAVVDHFHNRVSSHGSKAVSRLLQRIKKKPQDFWNELSGDGFDSPANTLDEWTEKRHEIVHRGKSTRVLRDQATDLIALEERIVEKVDGLACQFMRDALEANSSIQPPDGG